MIKYLFLLALRSDQCVSPLITPPPIPNATLIQAQLVFRHGSRTPGNNYSDISTTGEWHCDHPDAISPRFHAAPVIHPRNYHQKFDQKLMPYPPSCRKQDLLIQGMAQHLELGQLYRDYFISNNKLISENYQPWEIFPRSTNVDRALRSTMSFLQGMYPPASPNEVIQIMTDSDSAELLDASDDFCSELVNQTDDFTKSKEFLDYFEVFSKKYRSFLEPIIGSWKPPAVKKFTSYVLMVNCTNHSLPPSFTDQLIDDCVDFMGFWHFGLHDNDKYRGVACAPIYREIIRMADEYLAMKMTQKLVLIGSHDTELSAMLATVGYRENIPPVVRGHFLFELWDNHQQNEITARISYNGKPLPIRFLNNRTTFPYSHFKSEMMRIGYLDHCFVPEWNKY